MDHVLDIALQVSSIFSLVAFIAALVFLYFSGRISSQRKLIDSLPKRDRMKALTTISERYHINTTDLSEEKKYKIVMEQLGMRRSIHRNIFRISITVAVLLMAALIVAIVIDADASGDKDTPNGATLVCYQDRDGDRYGNPGAFVPSNAECPEGFVSNDDDTDDTNEKRYPGETIWYRDDDGDGYGNKNKTLIQVPAPDGYVNNADDIDDRDRNRNIGSAERTWYRDQDRDGFGDEKRTRRGISKPPSYIAIAGDLDDQDANVFPGQTAFFTAPSRGNGTWDYNCDGTIEHKFNTKGKCKGKSARPSGWVGNVPDCGMEGSWFNSCQVQIEATFPVKTKLAPKTKKVRQACR